MDVNEQAGERTSQNEQREQTLPWEMALGIVIVLTRKNVSPRWCLAVSQGKV